MLYDYHKSAFTSSYDDHKSDYHSLYIGGMMVVEWSVLTEC